MTRVYCDTCGQVVQPPGVTRVKDIQPEALDLCDGCLEQLREILAVRGRLGQVWDNWCQTDGGGRDEGGPGLAEDEQLDVPDGTKEDGV